MHHGKISKPISDGLIELRIGEWLVDVAQGLFHEFAVGGAVREGDFEAGLIVGKRGVGGGGGQFADALDLRVIDCLVGIFLQACFAANQAHGGAMIDAELAF